MRTEYIELWALIWGSVGGGIALMHLLIGRPHFEPADNEEEPSDK